MNEQTTIENLSPNHTDFLTEYTKGGLGAIPFFGALFGEIVGQIIPNQRVDRIVEFLKILDSRLNNLEIGNNELKERMKEESYINFFEEGIWQVARSSSNDRKEYIASMLANGISDESLEKIEGNILLSLLGQLNDNEIVILFSHTRQCHSRSDDEFDKKHKNILSRPSAHMGSSQEEHDRVTMYDTYHEKLVRLNLLRKKFKTPKKNEMPEFDEKTGMLKGSGYSVTPLGKIFLKYIDMLKEE